MRLSLLAPVMFFALATGAAPAQAQKGQPESVVVAAIPGAELRAYEQTKDDFCVGLWKPGKPFSGDSACGDLVGLGFSGAQILEDAGEVAESAGGVVPPDVARVTIIPTAGEPVSVDTVPGTAYQGKQAGRFRFFLAAQPKGTSPLEVRQFAADGTLLAVEELERVMRKPVAGPSRIGTIRDGSRALHVEVEVQSQLFASVVDPGARKPIPCLTLRRAGSGPRAETDVLTQSCLRPPEGVTASQDLRFACGPARGYLSGFTAPGEPVPTLVLGSGRRLQPRGFALPRSPGGGRGWVAVIPAREALRRFERRGQAPLTLGFAPAGATCRAFPKVNFTFFLTALFGDGPFGDRVTPAAPPAPAAGQGPGALLAADAPTGELCLTIRRVALRGSDCQTLARGEGGRVISAPLPGGSQAVGG